MINRKETNQQSNLSWEKGLQALAYLLNLAEKLRIKTTPLIEEVCHKSGLSPKDGKFTNQMTATANQLRKVRK